MSDQYVWIVTYWDDDGCEPTVTAFDNEKAARECYKCFSFEHHVCIDKAQVFKSITYTKPESEDEGEEEVTEAEE